MRKALAALPGVRHVHINFETKIATISVDKSADKDDSRFVKALDDAGFGGTVTSHGASQQKTPENGNNDTSGLPPKPGLTGDGTITADFTARSGFGKRVSVQVHADRDGYRPGDAFRIAVVVDVAKNWHVYGNPVGPGVGKPTVISAAPVSGIQFDPARYAPAHKADQDFGDGNTTWVWEHTGRSVHFLTGRIAESAQPGDVQLTIKVAGQSCSAATCIPGKVTTPLTVRVVGKDSPTKPTHSKWFAGFDKTKPAPAGE
ncbi:MAG: cation transporter [Planctomycetaceae bacterium]